MFNRITRNSRVLRLNWYLNDDKMLRSRWTVENTMLGVPHKPFGLCGFYSSLDDVDHPNLPCVPHGPGIFQPMHLLVIIGLALLMFGPKKIPELGKGIGEGIRGFKSASNGNDAPTAETQDSSLACRSGQKRRTTF